MAKTSPRRQRRKLKFKQRLIVGGTLFLGLVFILSALASFVDRADLTEVIGPIHSVERKSYWEDVVLYVRVTGAAGRFKYEHDQPKFADFDAGLSEGLPVRLLVETSALDLDHPAPIFAAEFDGEPVILFEETSRAHNREVWLVMLLGPIFWFLGIWIWHRATRPLPTPEETAAYEARLTVIAEQRPYLFLTVHVVNTIRGWGEEIPKLGDLFTVFLFFWILPLYMVFVYVTAQSYRRFVAIFCCSYWAALVILSIAAVTVPDFPGGEEYPFLGSIGSRLFHTYLLLNLSYGGAMWLWGTLMYEPEPTTDMQPTA